jgi:carbon-monoxide dehydrogenase small subunit
MKRAITLRVNGVEEEIFVEPWWRLSRVLREDLGLKGLKVGCGTGDCGACTVLIDGKAVKSCLYPVMKACNKDITTIEGLAGTDGQLDPLQTAFVERFAVQCGYCTSGMIMAAKALFNENSDPTEEEIRIALAGNLCRCTGYTKILEAVEEARDGVKSKED